MKDEKKTFIHFQKQGENHAGYVRQEAAPSIIGKVIKLRRQDEADNYATKQVNYNFARIDGFNIFIIHAGFFETPRRAIPEYEIIKALDSMCEWYYTNKIEGKKIIIKTYKNNPS